MAFKFVVLACVMACANAGLIAAPAATSSSYSSVSHGHTLAHAAPVAYHAVPVYAHAAPLVKKLVYAEEQHAPAQYEFSYAVHDPHTGDIKEQKEQRQGDAVHGMYSLVEADGSKRIVEYTADEHSGFNAVVHREPATHPVAVKAAPLIKAYAAPVAHYAHAAPVAHYAAAPVAHYAHAAPVAHYAAAPVVKAHYSAAPSVSYATFSSPTHVIHH